MSDEIRDSYDAIAKLYTSLALRDLDRPTGDRAELDMFAELAALGGGPVADLGCGPGHVSAHLAKRNLRTVGYDLSPKFIDTANEKFPELTFRNADITALDLDQASLGGIVARYSLIHMDPSSFKPVFELWLQLLQPGAPLLVSFFAAATSNRHGSPFDHAVATAYELFPPTIAGLLEELGFEHIEVRVRSPLEGERQLDHGAVLARKSLG